MVDLSAHTAGIERAMREAANYRVSTDPRADFIDAMHAAGYRVDGQLMLNRVVRIADTEDKGLKKTGWYWYTEASIDDYNLGIGTYGTWRDPDSKITWSSKSQNAMSWQEKNEYQEKINLARLEQKAEIEKRYGESAEEARGEYAGAIAAKDHEYLIRKGIAPVGGLMVNTDGILIVPIINEAGEIQSLQRIWPDGQKRNYPGGKMKGGYFAISGAMDRVAVCEGMATGVSIWEATGASVYCAMSAANLYEITGIAKRKHAGADLVICADDNSDNAVNVGFNAANQAAKGFGARVVVPAVKKDMNDMTVAMGKEAVATLIFPVHKKYQTPKEENTGGTLVPEPGFLRDVYDYYNTTSGNNQNGFAVQTAIALTSVILGRRYKTNNNNYTSLYLLNIGKSATGKEHGKTVVYKVLKAAEKQYLMGGSGYTSEGAVISTCLDKPRHISICDEFGRNIQAAKNSGDANFMGANSKLMEAIGACHTFLSPRNYSTMGATKEKSKDLARITEQPAISILAMSTPSTFFEGVDHKSIADGFLGRFIISVSDAKRDIRRMVADVPVPENIINWIDESAARSKSDISPDVSTDSPAPVILQITGDAWSFYESVQKHFNDQADSLEDFKMDDLNNRAHEFVLRLGLICALAENIKAENVELRHVEWAFKYIRAGMDRVLRDFKHYVSGSEFEAMKKEALIALRKNNKKGIPLKDMGKKQPFSKWSKKTRDEILDMLVESDLAFCEVATTAGRPAKTYYPKED